MVPVFTNIGSIRAFHGAHSRPILTLPGRMIQMLPMANLYHSQMQRYKDSHHKRYFCCSSEKKMEHPLIQAIIDDDLEKIKKLYTDSNGNNYIDINRNTPLMLAAMNGKISIVRWIIEFNTRTSYDSREGGLVSYNLIDPDYTNKFGENLLMAAAKSNSVDVLKEVLLQFFTRKDFYNQRNDGCTVLMITIMENRIENFNYLINHRWADEQIGIVNNEGQTALDIATTKGNTEMVDKIKDIIQRHKNYIGSIVIDYIKNDWIDNIQDILKKPNVVPGYRYADINDVDEEGNTFLMHAVLYSRVKIAEYFIEENVDVNWQNINGETALTMASGKDSLNIVEVLIGKNANVNHQRHDGFTPLMVAITNNRIENVQFLLENGADVSIKNNEDKTALDIAITKGYIRIIKILKKYV